MASESVGTGAESDVTSVTVTPANFEIRDVGVVLNVTPVVAPDGYTIDLTMLPQIVQLHRWIDYGYTLTRGDGSEQHVPMRQPIFYTRTIATSISIWDGQTVVMGGLITESELTSHDKVPVLGDLPLVGKLFSSKTSKSEKVNLLIFVTAYLVDPSGKKLNKGSDIAAAGQTQTGSAAAAQ
jgi:general secretion pathway protein D